MKTATLFGGAMNITESKEYIETIEIGKLLANAGFVVYNGGYGGMMEAVSLGATQVGGTAIGVTCTSFGSPVGNVHLSQTIPENDIFDRLRTLIMGKDVFIVQRGGIGTLAELFLLLDVIRKLKHPPKIVLYGEFWTDVMMHIEALMMRPKEKALYVILSDLDSLKRYLSL